MNPDQPMGDRPTWRMRSVRSGLVAVLGGADGPARRALAMVCVATMTASSTVIIEIVATNYLL